MSGDKLEDAATAAARPEPDVQPSNNPPSIPHHDAVAQAGHIVRVSHYNEGGGGFFSKLAKAVSVALACEAAKHLKRMKDLR